MDELPAPPSSVGPAEITGDAVRCWVAFRIGDEVRVAVGLRGGGRRRHWDVHEVAVTHLGPNHGLTSDDVRGLPLGIVLAEARRLATRQFAVDPAGSGLLDRLVAVLGTRLGTGDPVLAAVAEEYARLVATGDRSPAKTLAARHGGTPGTWTNRVAQARSRGFLESAVRGEAGGLLTPEARAVLRGTLGASVT